MWKRYEHWGRIDPIEMKAYVRGQMTLGISTAPNERMMIGGMVVRNVNAPHRKWYISEQHFRECWKEA